jgi:hypothetical protein
MNEYPNPYAQPTDGRGAYGSSPAQPRLSGLAVASLVCSLIFCCPIVTLIGPLLGLSAIVSISAHPAERRGKGLAIAGIIIGLITTAAGGLFLYWVVMLGRGMFEFADQEVPAALHDAFDGKFDDFRARLTPAAARAADDTVTQAFLDLLTNRYGAFVDAGISETMQSIESTQNHVILPLQLEFEGGKKVEADAVLQLDGFSPDGWRLHSITIHDSTGGSTTFP